MNVCFRLFFISGCFAGSLLGRGAADIVQQVAHRLIEFLRHLELAVQKVVQAVAVAFVNHHRLLLVTASPDQQAVVFDPFIANIAERAEAVESVDVDHFNHRVAAFRKKVVLCFRFHDLM